MTKPKAVPPSWKSSRATNVHDKRLYGCPRCKKQRHLRPGVHWHTCHGYTWRADDIVIEARIQSMVGHFRGLLRGLMVRDD